MSISAAEAVEAWAEDRNNTNQLAGRQIVVERIETNPLIGDHAEAINIACNRDFFALVGSIALFDGDGLEQLESPDCGLPDFPAVVNSIERLGAQTTVTITPDPAIYNDL